MTETFLNCKKCKTNTLHKRPSPNHILHLILSIITGGIWIIMWCLIAFLTNFTPYTCNICGNKKIH